MNITKDNVWMITLVVLIAAFIVFVTWETPQSESNNPQIVASASPQGFDVDSFGGCDPRKANPSDAIVIQANDFEDAKNQTSVILEDKFKNYPDWNFDFRLTELKGKYYDIRCVNTGVSSEMIIFDITSFYSGQPGASSI